MRYNPEVKCHLKTRDGWIKNTVIHVNEYENFPETINHSESVADELRCQPPFGTGLAPLNYSRTFRRTFRVTKRAMYKDLEKREISYECWAKED